MPDRKKIAGYALFLVFGVLAAAAAYTAFSITGTQGIEERFESATGLAGDKTPHGDTAAGVEDHNGGSGFSLEGNPVLYFAVLSLLAAAGIIAYRNFRI